MPAKGSSSRISNKNLSILDGEYLFKRKLRQLLSCPQINEVVLDTDSDEIAALASDLPVKTLNRPAELASNTTDGHELFAWECGQVKADIYLQALCTAPFVSSDTLIRAIEALDKAPACDSLVGVTHTKQYLWSMGEPAYGRGRIPNSVDLAQTTIESMSLYVVRSSVVALKKRFGKYPLLFPLTPMEAVDVNWPEDLNLAETISSGLRARENLQLGALVPYLTSAMLSDITREMGLDLALPREISGSGRFFGRAKTLQLDIVRQGEAWQGIYKALDSYDFIRPGDVILVKNPVKDRAYFGNLNAQLAMRAGAIGAVIDGITRDCTAVKQIKFPVYSHGHYCVDIRKEGTLRGMNTPIEIGGVRVENGDYIFADEDGVVVIPYRIWSDVKERILEGIEKEWKVGMAVALGIEPKSIIGSYGEF